MNHLSSDKKKMCDIAELAGVSPSTVSRALNGSPLVNVKTREKIQSLAKQHHYAINKQAQNLRLQSCKTVAVVVPLGREPTQYISDPFFLEIIGAIADSVTTQGFELLLSRVPASSWYDHVMSHRYVDGVIVLGQSSLHQEINDIARQQTLPMVVWGAALVDQEYVTVGSDNIAGGRLAGQHLVARGCKKIVVLGDLGLPEMQQRYEGFCEALTQNGIQHHPELQCVSTKFTHESGMQAMQTLYARDLSFDGIFATSDVLASCAIKFLTAKNVSVPGQVRVVGYDDIALASYMTPAITTVSQQICEGGRTLVNLLFQQIAGYTVQSVQLQPQLLVRQTS